MMRALVVTADPGEAMRWASVLSVRGHHAERVEPGRAAERQVDDEQWSLVIAHALPDGVAEQLIRRIRQRQPHGQAFILAVLASAHARHLHPLLHAGADDVLLGEPEPPTMRARLLAAERRLGIISIRPAPIAISSTSSVPSAAVVANPPSGDRTSSALSIDVQGIINDLNNALAAASGGIETTIRSLPADPLLARTEATESLLALRDVGRLVERLHLAIGGHATTAAMPPPIALDDPTSTPPRATILLIDDDARVRRPLRRALEVQGWVVHEASDGDDGLALHTRLAQEVALVVVDMRMPRVPGMEVLRELRRRRPSLPVVLVSGHAADELVQPDGLAPDAFLRKPFELVDLARTVRRLLDQTPTAV